MGNRISGRNSPNFNGRASPQRGPRSPPGFGFGGSVSQNHGAGGVHDYMYTASQQRLQQQHHQQMLNPHDVPEQ